MALRCIDYLKPLSPLFLTQLRQPQMTAVRREAYSQPMINLLVPRYAMLLLALLAASAVNPVRAQSQRSTGDFLAIALPVATLGVELYRGDVAGAGQYALTFAATTLSTELLKHATQVERPDGSDNLSFPSGHAAKAFSAAAYVRARHGFKPAIPVYLAALYVGHTRVAAKRHRWVDVAGAALLAEASAAWLVRRRPDSQVMASIALDRDTLAASLTARW